MAVKATFVDTKVRDLIKIDIGNFPINSKAKLTCFMYTNLQVVDKNVTFMLPLCYIPKYMDLNHHQNDN